MINDWSEKLFNAGMGIFFIGAGALLVLVAIAGARQVFGG